MIQVSDLYKEASRYSHTMTSMVECLTPGKESVFLPLTDGKVTCDRTKKVRWSVDISLAYSDWEAVNIDTHRSRLRVWRGISSLGSTELVQLGEYGIDNWARADRGQIEVSGSSLESYIIDARFLQPRTPPRGASTVQTIQTLVSESVPGDPVAVYSAVKEDKRIALTAPWDRERIEAITTLAESISAELYCNNAGQFVLRNKPTLADLVPLTTFKAGPGELLISRSEDAERDKVYNAVVVTNQSSNSVATPLYGIAIDDNPESPTFFYGPYGQVPRFYASQFFTNNEQCARVARDILRDSLIPSETFKFEIPAVIWLEAGDTVRVEKIDGTLADYLISSVSVGLGVSGRMTANTYSARALDEEVNA